MAVVNTEGSTAEQRMHIEYHWALQNNTLKCSRNVLIALNGTGGTNVKQVADGLRADRRGSGKLE